MDEVAKPLGTTKKKKLAKGLGTGMANKAATAILDRQARMEAEMDEAMGIVSEKKTASRSAY